MPIPILDVTTADSEPSRYEACPTLKLFVSLPRAGPSPRDERSSRPIVHCTQSLHPKLCYTTSLLAQCIPRPAERALSCREHVTRCYG